MSAPPKQVAAEPALPAGGDELERQLACDLAEFRSAFSGERRARVLAGLERGLQGKRPAARRRFGAWALATLAALAAVLVPSFLRGADTVEPAAVDASPSAASNEPAAPAARSTELAGIVRVPEGGLRRALDEPLLDEARRLADDGARVAAALVQRLPGPLRLAFRARAER